MDNWIPISYLNDFVFCPYSIYLHNVYLNIDEGEYQALPQTRGKVAHSSVDSGMPHKKTDKYGLSIISYHYGLIGKIDVYKGAQKTLIERKYELKQIYQGQLYQLWAQYFCMKEMGYEIESLGFYDISSRKTVFIKMPGKEEVEEFEEFLKQFRFFNPESFLISNPNKCKHCIYSNLCDKATEDNVYY